MVVRFEQLQAFVMGARCVLVKVSDVAGSTPRETDANMLVNEEAVLGTIGGGQVEFIAIDTARRMLRSNEVERVLDVPLGPDIGQCCGGRMVLELTAVTVEDAQKLLAEFETRQNELPNVYIMGAGHVGRALAVALSVLPFKTIVVDTRQEALIGLPQGVEPRLSALPEAEVRKAPKASMFVILTHDHALDFVIALEALNRGDATFVGMIGSKSKRATFFSWLSKSGDAKIDGGGLTCPIGGEKPRDKRPEVIAALVAAQLLGHSALPQGQKSKKNDMQHLLLSKT